MSQDPSALARRWFEEFWNCRRVEVVEELLAPDIRGLIEGGVINGREGFRAACLSLLEALPDLRVDVDDCIAQDDRVAVRWTAAGTHTGTALGLVATGRPVSFRGMTWLIIRDGKIVEGWDAWNQGALVQSLQAPGSSATGA
jgi:steroid delta-isomerase-like uncharacterized protein